jgi:hypothetical protein
VAGRGEGRFAGFYGVGCGVGHVGFACDFSPGRTVMSISF